MTEFIYRFNDAGFWMNRLFRDALLMSVDYFYGLSVTSGVEPVDGRAAVYLQLDSEGYTLMQRYVLEQVVDDVVSVPVQYFTTAAGASNTLLDTTDLGSDIDFSLLIELASTLLEDSMDTLIEGLTGASTTTILASSDELYGPNNAQVMRAIKVSGEFGHGIIPFSMTFTANMSVSEAGDITNTQYMDAIGSSPETNGPVMAPSPLEEIAYYLKILTLKSPEVSINKAQAIFSADTVITTG